jgi:fibronectin-binding autotransporter adhesin
LQGNFANNLGSSSATLTISNGATLHINALDSEVDKQFDLHGDGVANTLEVTGGNNSYIGGAMTLNGDCVFSVDTGYLLNLNLNITGTANVVETGTGTNVFSVNKTAGYAGTTTLSNGVLVVNATKNNGTGITVWDGGTLAGKGFISEAITVNNGTLMPGDPVNEPISTLYIDNKDMTLNGGTSVFTLLPGQVGASVSGVNNLMVNGTNTIVINPLLQTTPLDAGDVYTLFTYNGTTTATTNNLELAHVDGYTFEIVDPSTTPGKIQMKVLTAAGNLLWSGSQNNQAWDINTTANFVKLPDYTPSTFTNGDFVKFDDSGTAVNGTNVVNILDTVEPRGYMVFEQNANPYLLQGSGSITGAAGMQIGVIPGGGLAFSKVIFANSGNTFSGPIVLGFGGLQIGTGGTTGDIGSGPMISTNVNDVGGILFPLLFDRSDDGLVLSNDISGGLAVTNLGAGMVTLAGNSSFTGGVTIASGTIRAMSDTALGLANTNDPVLVSNGATLDVDNNAALTSYSIVASGAGVNDEGAIVNNSGDSAYGTGPNIARVTLTGDTTFGGSGRLDLRAESGNPGGGDSYLSTEGNPYNVTKVGTNQFQVAYVPFDPALSNIDVQAGEFGLQGLTNFGDPNGTITVESGALLDFYDQTDDTASKKLVLEDGSELSLSHGHSRWNGPITMVGSNYFNLHGGNDFTVSGALSGTPDVIVKDGSKHLILDGNSLPAFTVLDIADSTIDITGAASSTQTLSTGQTIRGTGTLDGDLDLAGGTVSPGEPAADSATLGNLTVSGAVTTSSGGTVFLELNTTNSSTDHDKLSANSVDLTGATLIVTNTGPDFVGGETFQIFSTAVTGTPADIKLPALTGGLTWVTNIFSDGSISVAAPALPTIGTISIENGNLVLSGTNNTGASGTYTVLTTTNITEPLANWQVLTTGSFNPDGSFSITNAVGTNSEQYYILQEP